MYKLPKKPEIKLKTRQPDQRHFAVVPLSVIKKNITAGQYRVLIALASYCNKAGFSYVSLEKIGQDLNISMQAVQQHMKKLEKADIVKTFKNYYPGIKGSTRRIIYNEKISDKDAAAIAGEPMEPYTNKEINDIYRERKGKNINELERSNKALGLDQTKVSDNELLARLKMSVSSGQELAMINRDERLGLPISVIIHKYKYLLG